MNRKSGLLGLTISIVGISAIACGSSGDGDAVRSAPSTQTDATSTPEVEPTTETPATIIRETVIITPTPDPLASAFSMGGADLGGTSSSEVLFALPLGFTPTVPVQWIAHQVTLAPGEEIEHAHEFSFLYAADGGHNVVIENSSSVTSVVFEEGGGHGVPERLRHKHRAVDETMTFWEIRLAETGSDFPEGYEEEGVIFRSGPLQGIPERPAAAFVLVTVPPGGETSVHTHPGPEFIYQYEGVIDYENDFELIEGFLPGQFEGIPARTAVQKRNRSDEPAIFLSWFLVDSEQPFASLAQFVHEHGDSDSRGPNLALISNGATVTDFSSSFGSGTTDSRFGANSAIDGDPSTEWSSFNDGDDAFIEITLAERTNVTSVGFWTRTMGTSAEIMSFTIVTDEGETIGPLTLDGASAIKYFDTDFTARTLRFAPSASSGGNVGAVEIEVYGEPAE